VTPRAVVERVRELWRGYTPPDFAHVPDPDAAIFLCAVDHKTGYERAHLVDEEGPFEGSELMWAGALRRSDLLNAGALREVEAPTVAELFAVDEETVADPDRRAELWRDLAAGLERDYDGSAQRLLDSAGGRLANLLDRLAAFEAYADPLAKKSQLYAKICERRGWLSVSDPENWEVSADNVLMRLALRSGLVAAGDLEQVRAATRDAFKRVALDAGIPPPELDDMLWELGRDDPDLLGVVADVAEPPRDPTSTWY
jgi:hypothetical protein